MCDAGLTSITHRHREGKHRSSSCLKDLCTLHEQMAWNGLNPVNLSCSFGLEMVDDTLLEVIDKK